jgi:hypothetical protein
MEDSITTATHDRAVTDGEIASALGLDTVLSTHNKAIANELTWTRILKKDSRGTAVGNVAELDRVLGRPGGMNTYAADIAYLVPSYHASASLPRESDSISPTIADHVPTNRCGAVRGIDSVEFRISGPKATNVVHGKKIESSRTTFLSHGFHRCLAERGSSYRNPAVWCKHTPLS